MSQINKILVTKILFLIFLLNNANFSYATGCKFNFASYTNCVGDVGYIYISPVYYDKDFKKFACNNYFFKERTLPKEGSMIHPTNLLSFYQNLEEIKNRFDKCESEAKSFKHKDVFKTIKEADSCYINSCMIAIDQYEANGDEEVLRAGNELKVISYLKLKEGMFAQVKVIK